MGELDAELGRAVAPADVDDVLERRFAVVRIEPEATVRNAAMAFHMGRLHDDEAGAGIGEHAEMGDVPVAGGAVIGAVLAHRRHDNAIVELDAGKLDRGEQRYGHANGSVCELRSGRMNRRG